MGSVLLAIEQVLTEAGEPLHYKEITHRALTRGLWETDGTSPEATVRAQIAFHIKKHKGTAKFRRVGPGTFELTGPSSASGAVTSPPQPPPVERLSFTDAAERVLQETSDGHPMYYRDITTTALQLGLIQTSGRTPEATLYASILEETQRYKKRGERPRFHMHGKGMIGLTEGMPTGIPSQIDRHNREVRQQLHKRLLGMPFGEFEDLVGVVLGRLGFDDVDVTARHGDKGIDVRGTLVIEGAIRVRMAVQVKKWKHNVQSPEVQKVRGSLGAHEHGLIITTSDFGAGARTEATRPDAIPIGIMNGQQLINLLFEHEIGVRKAAFEMFELDAQEVPEPGSGVED